MYKDFEVEKRVPRTVVVISPVRDDASPPVDASSGLSDKLGCVLHDLVRGMSITLV